MKRTDVLGEVERAGLPFCILLVVMLRCHGLRLTTTQKATAASYTHIDDLSALSSLAVVNLSHNALTDISGLAGCINLAHLDVVRVWWSFSMSSMCPSLSHFRCIALGNSSLHMG